MLDGQLIITLSEFLVATAAEISARLSLANLEVTQSAQPTQQGTATNPSIYFMKVNTIARGWPGIKYDFKSQPMTETVTQLKETTFQISGLHWQDPTAENVVTAADIIEEVHMAFMSPAARASMEALNVRILRVDDIRNPYFEDDKHVFEAYPHFFIVLTHASKKVTVVPSTRTVVGNDYPVP